MGANHLNAQVRTPAEPAPETPAMTGLLAGVPEEVAYEHGRAFFSALFLAALYPILIITVYCWRF
jgi:hypothetical protein